MPVGSGVGHDDSAGRLGGSGGDDGREPLPHLRDVDKHSVRVHATRRESLPDCLIDLSTSRVIDHADHRMERHDAVGAARRNGRSDNVTATWSRGLCWRGRRTRVAIIRLLATTPGRRPSGRSPHVRGRGTRHRFSGREREDRRLCDALSEAPLRVPDARFRTRPRPGGSSSAGTCWTRYAPPPRAFEDAWYRTPAQERSSAQGPALVRCSERARHACYRTRDGLAASPRGARVLERS